MVKTTLFTQVLALLPEGVWVCDQFSHTVHRNPAAVALWSGVRDADVSRFPGCLGWWPDTGRPIGEDEWGLRRALKAGQAVLDERIEIETTTGARKVLLTSYVPLQAEAGESPGCVVLIKDITALFRAEQRLATAQTALHALSQRMLQVQEDERRHLAQELHDDVGQVVAAMRLQLARMVQHSPDAVLRDMATDALHNSEQLGAHLRQITLGLRPLELDDFGVMAALRGLVRSLGKRPALAVVLQATGEEHRYPSGVETAAFRIAQEAISNAMRHSHCRTLRVQLAMAPATLRLCVADDGDGFDLQTAQAQALGKGQIGLTGMQERARLAGGQLRVRSRPGRGTTVSAQFAVPVPRAESP